MRGVAYGTFRPNAETDDYPTPDVVESDFAAMAANGINCVRTYTAPPRWLLDLAAAHGVRVLVGLAWEQHVAFLDDRRRAASIERRVREDVRRCAGHPAVLCYAVGNEIPAPIVRWHGRRRVERAIERLYRAAKAEDAEALVTYVNYPSTEYLELPFLDLVCFNVFLEQEDRLEAYLARLQTIAGDRPLIVTELGLDSVRHGAGAQAASVASQIRTAFRAGCAGAVVFSWTDEWHRGGYDVDDWAFGLTTRDRRPKPALEAARAAFAEVPLPDRLARPRVSVVVCTHNGAATLGDCLEGISQLDYPDFETIVVDDGSTDGSAAIAERFDVRLIRTANRGLSAARNAGLAAATGEIVAYTDDDARPDPHWLRYLVAELVTTTHAGVGGPNLCPPGDGPVADAVARTPGGPVHVLLSDREAEHVPGCNMAFWKDRLEELGGFDPQFRIAGDDVDLCWRVHERGWTIGFSPAALVWHRRRNSVRAFLRQQRGYGEAEALLERKWPQKYNRGGHVTWQGRVYGGGATRLGRWRVYYGTWGTSLFQSLYEPAPGLLRSLPLMPEWHLLVGVLAAASVLDLALGPLVVVPLVGIPLSVALLALAVAGPAAHALRAGWNASREPKLRVLTALLHLAQPLARLAGRIRGGLTPWRRRARRLTVPAARSTSLWSEQWREPSTWLASLEDELRAAGAVVRRGGDFDRWDLELRGGALATARLRFGVEEHGEGKQLARFRIWPRWSRAGLVLALAGGAAAAAAAAGGSLAAAGILGVLAALTLARMAGDGAAAVGTLLAAVRRQAEQAPDLLTDLDERLAAARAQGALQPAGAGGEPE